MKQQHTLMKFDPATGAEKPYPSHAEQWRKYRGAEAWLFNPWTGARRLAGDVGTDVFGLLVLPPGEPLYASSAPLEGLPRARSLSDELMDCVDRLGAEFGSVDRRVERVVLAELALKTGELIEHLQKTGRLKPCFYLPALADARNALEAKRG